MKRPWVIGCLAVVVLVVGVGGALAYRYVGRPALATMNAARELARIPQIENRVQNRASFSPPTDGVLTQDQVDRYLRAANGIRTDLEVMGADLGARFEALEERNDARAVRDLAIAYAELVRLIVRAKEVQVEALNDERFSLGEYAWVRTQVLSAAGLATYQVDLARVADASRDQVVREVSTSVPQENVALVQSLGLDLEAFIPLAAFGL
ncbi:MAG TPA: hypothetical protein VFF10_06065 [Trueperaceae bacterium]|nr:hypothetical protein [Trueperaceae bacterium]